MRQHPPAPRPSLGRAVSETRTAPVLPPKQADLTLNKVLAGAGAAATSAVLGSIFGAAGTLSGAALGSVASTVATTLYQRSLDRTRDTLVARIRSPRRSADGDPPTIPMPRVPSGSETVRLRAEPAVAPPRPWGRWAAVTVLVFVLGLVATTGLEWAKGSTLTRGEPGTSVGRVLNTGAAADATPVETPATTEPTTPDPTSDPTTDPTADPTADPTTDPTTTSPTSRSRPSTPVVPPSETPVPGDNGGLDGILPSDPADGAG